eukprot:14933445-Heterocapsa_arctica.AAC.1
MSPSAAVLGLAVVVRHEATAPGAAVLGLAGSVRSDAASPSVTARRTTWKDGRHRTLNAYHEVNAKSEPNCRRRLRLTTIQQAAKSA